MPNLLVCVVHGLTLRPGFGFRQQSAYYRVIMAVDPMVDEFCDPETGILERPIPTEPMDVPDFIELDGDRLIYSWWGARDSVEHGVAKPRAKMLESFVKLADGPDARILAFARRWGPLHLCAEHGWPLRHLRRKDDPCCLSADVPERGAQEWYSEPLDAWRSLSGMALGLLHIAAALRDGRVGAEEDWRRVERGIRFELPLPLPDWPESAKDWDPVWWQRTLLPHVVDYLFTEISHVGLEIEWNWDTNNLGLKLGGRHLFASLMTELVFAMSGTAGFVNCAGCGTPFAPRRQPTPGMRHYCPDCGRAAANRAAQARFRANHKGYFSTHTRKQKVHRPNSAYL